MTEQAWVEAQLNRWQGSELKHTYLSFNNKSVNSLQLRSHVEEYSEWQQSQIST